MADASTPKATGAKQSGVTVPDDIRTKYPDLIELIMHSESMNDEERQYWVNILPIMTPEQVQNLREILMNEKKQLEAIDKKYSSEIAQIGQKQLLAKTSEERKKRHSTREAAEQESQQKEAQKEAELLKKIESL